MSSEGFTDRSGSSFILVLGVAGSGKSTFIRDSLGGSVDNEPPAVTSAIQEHQHQVSIQGKRLILVDTPGTNSSKDILADIQEWMGSEAISFDYIHGIVFLHPIDLNRADMRTTQQILDKLLGTGKGFLYRRVVLVTSLWPTDEIPEALKVKYTNREALLQEQLWGPLLKKGATVQRYDGAPGSSSRIIESLLSAPEPDRGVRAQGVREYDVGGRLSESKNAYHVPELHTPRWMSFRSFFKSHAGKRVIVLLGPSGSGKSSFVAHVTGRKVKIGDGPSPCTTRLKIYEKHLQSGNVIVIDTPGYDIGDGDVLELLGEWFNAQNRWNGTLKRQEEVKPSAFLFFHRISDARTSSIARAYSSTFRTAFTERDMPLDRIHVATTMWDQERGVGDTREMELKSGLWAGDLRDESYHRLEQGGDSALSLFDALVEHRFDTGVPLPHSLRSAEGTTK
ncbi:hypothetical protein P691DRAFT_334987 [Macrolepiota fuliginosa MF-IS2]|uniref:G domain-containing protein n=1 Tax=Macrolepiota fuliginosa MF-IS2 TaxID=1400762 RepID=A0A9P5X844_9AGAR|nr:hypothetical protein P691DRAFT_334987 [Macrolepiota fuliginosa MF-IS2]